ncbi:MutT/nudix family protein [Legionella lansingensis]|uniref:MutT/nudix family protein n=1 Tax=Legionella lansingensis TaxID=45067 RepID=A0A0W0VF15_9GAMM|nr:NUDIX domain-containing protein [Legionella lansingensis]KTD18740.1 MutT/nudix family protein [Legionella lansingensis]SNV58373.1 MutT/nudix family protein [Legionella lansingensis]
MRLYYLFRCLVLAVLGKKTVGVRILLIDNDHVLLVKHTYQQGFWYTIGGGVERGETPRQAMERELQEEVGVTLTSPLELFSVYHHREQKRDDYVIFYIGRGCIQKTVTSDEIAQQQWFPLDQLPDDLSPATRRRIQEYLGEREISECW